MALDKKTIIDGIAFSIPVIEIQRTADILDKIAERTEDGDLYREVIGTYLNYQIGFGTENDIETYDALFKKLAEPVPFHDIVLPINNEFASFRGYISSVQDSVDVVEEDGTRFKGLTCNFKAKLPTIIA